MKNRIMKWMKLNEMNNEKLKLTNFKLKFR